MTPLPIFDLGQVASTAVLDQLREGIIVTDERGSIRYVNEAARVMHGVAELDVVPEEYSERYHLFTIEVNFTRRKSCLGASRWRGDCRGCAMDHSQA